jgi:hypothetical protein
MSFVEDGDDLLSVSQTCRWLRTCSLDSRFCAERLLRVRASPAAAVGAALLWHKYLAADCILARHRTAASHLYDMPPSYRLPACAVLLPDPDAPTKVLAALQRGQMRVAHAILGRNPDALRRSNVLTSYAYGRGVPDFVFYPPAFLDLPHGLTQQLVDATVQLLRQRRGAGLTRAIEAVLVGLLERRGVGTRPLRTLQALIVNARHCRRWTSAHATPLLRHCKLGAEDAAWMLVWLLENCCLHGQLQRVDLLLELVARAPGKALVAPTMCSSQSRPLRRSAPKQRSFAELAAVIPDNGLMWGCQGYREEHRGAVGRIQSHPVLAPLLARLDPARLVARDVWNLSPGAYWVG